MSLKNREIVLICPICSTKGFLRKKHTPFHLPHKNNISRFYDLLDYLAKLHYRFFRVTLFLDKTMSHDNLPLKIYNKVF
ncbi:MAG: hypothetical protein L0H53_05600, partial [Candidatus Nitrosocosmicus sp.]|nr:hypothetical protein [Candidatus Nitrosocosmicus sp.]